MLAGKGESQSKGRDEVWVTETEQCLLGSRRIVEVSTSFLLCTYEHSFHKVMHCLINRKAVW